MSAAPTLRLQLVPEQRPRTRGDCARVPRPGGQCPHITCRHNLAPEVGRHGHRTRASAGPCALDLVDEQGPMTLDAIAQVFDVSRERIRQIETKALRKARDECERRGLSFDALARTWSDRRG